MDYTLSLLFNAIGDAFDQKKTAEYEQLPQGVYSIKPSEPKNLADRIYRVLFRIDGQVIVTMEGVPDKEKYQRAIDAANREADLVSPLTLHDKADALFEGLQQKGAQDFKVLYQDNLVARIEHTPQMAKRHRVTVYNGVSKGAVSMILRQYLHLQQG